ncbi:MAG: two-component system sensor histidine kinase ZraS [Desulfovibrionaceae bacterium]|nr:two-component system sensor histidine kinase ZraS [Desulfovibrionaceae bacterium]
MNFRHFAQVSSSGKLLVLSALLIVAIMMATSLAAIKQADQSMAKLLGEKGASLIAVCESILRSGMRHEIGIRLQVLLEEMSTNPDLMFACVTMPDGLILAHSNGERIGEMLSVNGEIVGEGLLQDLHANLEAQWRFMNLEDHDVFVVYKLFTPSVVKINTLPTPIIFLGINVAPFEITRTQTHIYFSILSGISLLMLIASSVALFFAQRAKQSEQKQRQAEKQVRELEILVQRREKLAAVGSLAAGVAHEIRNPLSSIKGYATYFGELFAEDSDERACAMVMVQEVERLNRVICDLIGLAKPSTLQLQSVNPRELLVNLVRLLRPELLAQKIQAKIYQGPPLEPIWADPERLHQALLNLCLNAIKAMEQGGRLSLGVRNTRDGVTFVVLDTGTGIAPEVLSHIFDPYFTTRGNGTGLGLALVHKIIDAHKGQIIVRSRLCSSVQHKSGGSLFLVYVPRSGGTQDASSNLDS